MTTPLPQQQQPPASGDSREDLAAAAGAAVAALYTLLEAAIIAHVTAAVKDGLTGKLLPAVAARRMRLAVAADIAATETKATQALETSAAQVRRDTAAVVSRDLAHLGTRITERAATDARPGIPAVSNLLHQSGLFAFRRAQDVYRDAVRAAMDEATGIGSKVRDLEGPARISKSLSRLQAAQKVLDTFAEKGVTGFTDRAGRNWELAVYTEMATRTAYSRMHLALQLQLMAPLGVDLVVVDNPSHMPPCPKCRPWEGKVLSMTGDIRAGMAASATDARGNLHMVEVAGTLAEARAAGLLHPNCRHSLLPFTDGAAMMPLAGENSSGRVPAGTPQQYRDEQTLRAHERRVRAARRLLAAAATPQARMARRRRLRAAEGKLAAHVAKTGALRQPRREKTGVAR